MRTALWGHSYDGRLGRTRTTFPSRKNLRAGDGHDVSVCCLVLTKRHTLSYLAVPETDCTICACLSRLPPSPVPRPRPCASPLCLRIPISMKASTDPRDPSSRSMTTCFRQLFTSAGGGVPGVKRLFRGVGTTLARAVPVNAAIFPTYEWTVKLLNQALPPAK